MYIYIYVDVHICIYVFIFGELCSSVCVCWHVNLRYIDYISYIYTIHCVEMAFNMFFRKAACLETDLGSWWGIFHVHLGSTNGYNWWFGIPKIPFWKGLFLTGIPRIPNHQPKPPIYR